MAAPRFITLVNGTKTEEVSVTTSTPDSIPALDGSGLLNTNMLPGVSVDKGGTGLTSVPDASVLVSNATNVFSALVVGASQSIQRNPENTAWVAFTPGSGGGRERHHGFHRQREWFFGYGGQCLHNARNYVDQQCDRDSGGQWNFPQCRINDGDWACGAG